MANGRSAGRARGAQVAAAAALVLATAACGNGGGAGAAADSGGKGKIGFAQANFGNGWYEVQADGVKSEMAKLGYALTTVGGEGKPQTQISQVQTFISQGVKGLVLNPTDPLAVGSSIKALKDAKIPFVLVNTSLDPSLADKAYCYVAEDEVENARQMGIEMAKALKAKNAPGPAKALMVKGFPGDSNSSRRDKGFKEGYASVAGAPTLNWLPDVFGKFNADGAIGPVRAVATANPDLQVVFTVTDSMLPGIETALKGAGSWDKVLIAGYDARMSVVKEMADSPNGPIIATVANSPYEQGVIGSQMLDKAIKGVPQSEACPGGNYFLKPTVVTPADASTYYKADSPY
ncbi:substrate-binding domain-containing protein [Dactylosporangium maewongense]|uniref:Substrate-binding domain-containing protein n=1 Tax=Dactylosporangium maewongense TaxID=634393 RepID=A0ABN2D3F7_9ACTN